MPAKLDCILAGRNETGHWVIELPCYTGSCERTAQLLLLDNEWNTQVYEPLDNPITISSADFSNAMIKVLDALEKEQ